MHRSRSANIFLFFFVLMSTLSLRSNIHDHTFSPPLQKSQVLTGNSQLHAYSWGHYNSDPEPPQDQLNPDWISKIPDNQYVSMLSIPGTHNSGTFNCQWNQFCYISQCQSWNITGQLLAGIRLLDFRINYDHQDLYVAHGQQSFERLEYFLSDVKWFLQTYKREFIILSIQSNRGIEDKSYRIKELLSQLRIKYALYNKIPKVGQLRGSVWLVQGYGYESQYRSFPFFGEEGIKNDTFNYMQNIYKVYIWNVRQKKDKVLETAFNISCNKYRLKINYLSGSYGVFPFWLARTNGGTNQQLDMALLNNYKGCIGITIMDFPGTRLIRSIIYSNRGKNYNLIDPYVNSFNILSLSLTGYLIILFIFIY